MPAGGGLNCLPATSWLGGAVATGVASHAASNSAMAATNICRMVSPPSVFQPSVSRQSAVRRLAGLDPGLVKRLGLVVGRIGAGNRLALADAYGDELLQPLLLEGISRHLVGE